MERKRFCGETRPSIARQRERDCASGKYTYVADFNARVKKLESDGIKVEVGRDYAALIIGYTQDVLGAEGYSDELFLKCLLLFAEGKLTRDELDKYSVPE